LECRQEGDEVKGCCLIGGAGFIGSHLLAPLQASGRFVTVVGRSEFPARHLPEGVRYIHGDYCDGSFLRGVVSDQDEVILLAYTTVPQTSYDDPLKDLLSNVPAEVAFFEIASELPMKKILFVSSGGTVYGRAVQVPISEEHPTNPISPYGITKLTIEKYSRMYCELKSLPIVCVRPSNAYGEGQMPFAGQGFIATAMASILQGKEIVLYGEVGTVRDYVHVSDVASGMIAALDYGVPGECYNIGTGVGLNNRAILELLSPLAAAHGLSIKYNVKPPRPFDVPINILNSLKLRNLTGWQPTLPFEEGLQGLWNWIVRNDGVQVPHK
jgi:UDP-glucose 4-epimerase